MPNNFDPNQIAIVIITLYPTWYRGKLRSIKHTDKIRGDLALELITKTIGKGCHIVVVDGKSSRSFRKTLSQFPEANVKFRRSIKRSPAKRQAFKIASKIADVKTIIATEGEKVSLITDCLEQITKPIFSGEADIVIPKRDEKLFEETYPQYMYESENEGNHLYNEYLRANGIIPKNVLDFDFFFGPRVFKNDPKILKLFLKKFNLKIAKSNLPRQFLDPEELSNASFFPIILALKKKLKVVSVRVAFSYPKLQKENEEIGSKDYFVEKRKNQRLGLLLELIYFLLRTSSR